MKMTSHAEIMQQLSSNLDGLLEPLANGREVIYLDIPLHFNVGDLLINAGTEAFFRRSGLTCLLRATFFDTCTVDWEKPEQARLKSGFVRAVNAIDPAVPIVLHGGGSLGDIYPELQAMREAVVAAFPERRIILFPQSLHFDDPARQATSLSKMLSHRDIHVFLRDRSSLDATRSVSAAHGSLMPDMAHALWASFETQRHARPTLDTLTMCRRDAESRSPVKTASFDWPDVVPPTEVAAWRLIRKAMYADLAGHSLAVWAWYRIRDRIIRRGVGRFAQYRQIETDRLHGLLLGCLLERQILFRDNRYGKLSRYVNEWLSLSPVLHPAVSEGVNR